MTASAIAGILDNIYAALHNGNEGLDALIADLKAALAAAGQKTVEVDTAKLVQNNREGRKMMESYFRKRGVAITFLQKN